jgi:glycopeptide antibiotics resistance protein
VRLISTLPLLLPVLVAGIGLAAWAARPLARRLGAHPLVAFLLVGSVALIIAVTLTPFVGASPAEPRLGGWCDLSRVGPPPPSLLTRVNDVSLNVLLFVPLGLAVGLLPASSARNAVLMGALALPFAVEAIQSIVTPLGRGCESADVMDNLSGVLLGLAIAVAGRWLAALRVRAPLGR